jgi:hypothetical protein
MPHQLADDDARRNRELMQRVARSPEFCCCCIRLSREDRRRAKRVFRLSRRVTRAWEKELRENAKAVEARDSGAGS